MAVTSADDPDSCPGTCDTGGNCKAKRGQTCKSVAGGCVGGTMCAPDGYCCDTGCTGSCQACDISGKQGTCSPVTMGGPHTGHTACNSDGGSCGGSCSGKSDGTCNYPTASCGPASTCSADKSAVIPQSTCNNGSCPTPTAKTCGGNLVCASAMCKATCSSDGDCLNGTVCNSGACGMKIVKTGSQTYYADTALSGRVESGGTIDPRVSVGDYADNSDSCGFLSFPHSPAMPSGATVTSATLTMTLQSLTGTPYADLGGSMVVDDTSYTALSLSVYKKAFVSPTGVPNSNTAGTKTVTVTPMVTSSDISAGVSQFRLCFPLRTDGNNDQDFVLVPTGGTSKPSLTVNYSY